ncbi:unnamed protein product [Paramecium primaurelia]|uniref:Uncharacterized protein n=1 Tax=Paramecium primaurelia TaxID=5886 RepID=A0A8S1JQI9_PARPR|nr:unnamed protein product [Paramecium primaurelia]
MIVLIIHLLYIVQNQLDLRSLFKPYYSKVQSNLEVSSGTCNNSIVLDIYFKNDGMQIVIERAPYMIESQATISNLYAPDINGNLYGICSRYLWLHCDRIYVSQTI